MGEGYHEELPAGETSGEGWVCSEMEDRVGIEERDDPQWGWELGAGHKRFLKTSGVRGEVPLFKERRIFFKKGFLT